MSLAVPENLNKDSQEKFRKSLQGIIFKEKGDFNSISHGALGIRAQTPTLRLPPLRV